MTICVKLTGDIIVTQGYITRLRFAFNSFISEPHNSQYTILPLYDIQVSVQTSPTTWSFVGYGHLDPRQTWTTPLNGYSQPARWDVDVPLSSTLIEQIEAIRRPNYDSPVRFNFDWRMSYKPSDDQHGDNKMILDSVQLYENRQEAHFLQVSVPPQNWRNILRDYGFGERRLIEIVFPPVDAAKWRSAVQYLELADQAFTAGRDNDVLANCESALQEVSGVSFMSAPNDQNLQSILTNLGLTRGPKFDLIVNMIRSFVLFVRKNKHDTPPSPLRLFDARGRDAEIALIATKAILGYLSK